MNKPNLGFLLGMITMISVTTVAQNLSQAIDQQLTQLLENNELKSSDVQYLITDENVSSVSGVINTYYRQEINGLQIYGTESGIHMLPDGRIISESNKFIQDASEKLSGSSSPSLTSIQAVQAAANQLHYSITEGISVLEYIGGPSQQAILSDGGMSLSAIPAKLMYQLNDNEQLVLVWDISIQEKNQQNWWSMRVDASSGVIVDKNDWMVSCGFNHDHSEDTRELDFNSNLYDIPNYKELVAINAIGCSECYEVFAIPVESPYYGVRSTEIQPANLTASPFGWHDTDGVSGAEFTVTKGNNVDAYEDGNNSGFQPDGGSTLNFTGYPFNEIYTNTNQYESAAISNLFYWNNVFHDVLYLYGFDEAGGNFQENNYGNGGLGSDSVNAEAQDGSGTCNANFGTPGDGSNPTMQMYICNDKDGDFDNLVILHEYGHGVSNRLTGGPETTGCLSNQEQMGEGWSDYYGVVMTIEPGDTGTDARGVGTYLFGQGAGGPGIRPYPYSTDLAVDPQTYDDIKTLVAPHGVGSVWATTMWEVTWALIDEYGFDPDLYNFTGDVTQDAGNVQAFAIITEGMKLQPCSPGFVDGRDAIFAADIAIYGGANECILWDAFAKRGLGVSADQGSSASKNDGTEAFDTPSGLADFTAPEDVCSSAGILTDQTGGTPLGGVYSGPGVTDDGNGSTYSFDPAVAGVGVHTLSYEVMAGACTVASTAMDDIEVLAIPDSPITTGVSDFCIGDSVTVTATPFDPLNVIRWYDAPIDGNFLFEGTSYIFSPLGSVTVYAQENQPGPISQLVISELTLETPDRFEIQNVGAAFDYTGYTVAVSDTPYTNINSVNTITQPLGAMAADSVVDYNDSSGPGYWGNNLFWDNAGTGWIVIIDDLGNVIDSVFWNFSAGDIAGFNVIINGFNITAADLDWTGIGASLLTECTNSFRRNDDTNDASNWPDICLASDFGVPNNDLNIGFPGCLADRTPTDVTIDGIDPVVTCPADLTVTVDQGELFTIPDYTGDVIATDNCTATPVLTQDPLIGTMVGVGVTVITMTASDELGNEASCTFELTVDELLGLGDLDFDTSIVFHPNPTSGKINLVNNSSLELKSATITDLNGRIIQNIDLQNQSTETVFYIDNLSPGMYFAKIEAESISVIKRIVKQ
jgi:extracellular elastinolytic metalloproteinase